MAEELSQIVGGAGKPVAATTKQVTAIKPQARQKSRFTIFVGGKYAFSLSEGALLESGLRLGQELSGEEIGKLKQASAEDMLYQRALHFTALRAHSHWELEQYLKRKQASPALALQILNKLSKIGLVNDEAFARAWVGNRRLLRPTSRRRLLAELRTKRVPSDVIDKVLGEDETDERKVLRELIEKKRKQAKYRDDELKLMQYLARQGFNYDDIKSVLRSDSD